MSAIHLNPLLSDRRRLRLSLLVVATALVSLRALDVVQGKAALPRAIVMQHKTHRPVQL